MSRYDDEEGAWRDFGSERGGPRPTDSEPAWVRNLSQDQRKAYQKDTKVLSNYREIWDNQGQLHPFNRSMKIGMEEMLQSDAKHTAYMRDTFSSDWPSMTKRVIDDHIRHAVEPMATLAGQVFAIETLDPSTIPVTLAMGALHAAKIPEGGEYPERDLEIAGDTSHGFSKHGLAVKATDEILKWFRSDLLNQAAQLCANALVRLREDEISTAIETDGTTVIDNTDTAFKSTQGRADDGTLNGTLTVNDLWHVFRTATDAGFTPNALILHPSAWNIIMADESMRKAFDLDRGQAPLYHGPQGDPGGTPWHSSTPSLARQAATTPGEIASLRTGPNVLFPGISKIIPSAYMTWNNTTKRATIAMVDTNNCGVVQQATSSPEVEEWRDPAIDVNKLKLRWFWNVSSLNAGDGIWLMKSISTEQSTDWSNRISATVATSSFDTSLLSGQY